MKKEICEIERVCRNCGSKQGTIMELDRDCEFCEASFEEIGIHNPKNQAMTCDGCGETFVVDDLIYTTNNNESYCENCKDEVEE